MESGLVDQMELVYGRLGDQGFRDCPRMELVGAVGEPLLVGQGFECSGSQMDEDTGENSDQAGGGSGILDPVIPLNTPVRFSGFGPNAENELMVGLLRFSVGLQSPELSELSLSIEIS